MTPLEIEIALHYYARANDYRDGDLSAPAVRAAMDKFSAEGLIESTTDPDARAAYRRTPRLECYVHALCKTPLPIQQWVMPEQTT